MRRRARLLVLTPLVLFVGCLALAETDTDWPCHSDNDCEGGRRCVPNAQAAGLVCKDPPACAGALHCSAGSVCVANNCVAKGCEPRSEDCGAFVCDPLSYQCKTACQGAADCAKGKLCSQHQCIPVECSQGSTGQCGGYACAGGLCHTKCFDGAPCDKGMKCTAQRCEPMCNPQVESCVGGAAGAAGAGGAGGAGGSAGSAMAGASGASMAGAAGAPTTCDPIAKTGCTKAPYLQCSLKEKFPGGIVTQCVGGPGHLTWGQECFSSYIGEDECAPGLICTSYGVEHYNGFTSDHKQCGKFCRLDKDCPGSSFCAALSDDGFGVCVKGCEPFGVCTPSVNSIPKTVCSRRYLANEGGELRLGCRETGFAAAFEGCNYLADCKDALSCMKVDNPPYPYSGACIPLCDSAHPCSGAGGKKCSTGSGPCPADQVCMCL